MALVGGVVCAWSAVAAAAPPEPSRAHPRLFLDDATVARLKDLAAVPGSATARAVTRCNDVVANPSRYASGGAIGFDFIEPFGACAVAWIATSKAEHGTAAVKYFRALLDDKTSVGAGDGGNEAVRSDGGFAMRSYGPYAAIGYDWLQTAPGVDAALLAHARERFKAWTDWYDPTRGLTTVERTGYNYAVAGANYHAGWLIGATLISIAQASEAGPSGTALWQYVVDQQFEQIMKPALVANGVLDGGDWSEGWQYGPLSVVEYAMAARALRENGVALAGYAEWESEIVSRMLHARLPGGADIFNSGDLSNSEILYRGMPILALYAALIDSASEQAKGWAQWLIEDQDLVETSFLLVAALAEARVPAASALPDNASTWYYAPGTRVLHGRSDWSPEASWLVTRCMESQRAHDHVAYDAGNLVWSRGADHLVIDPSPYGSLSSLTGNAPTMESPAFATDDRLDAYVPSQGAWGTANTVGFDWGRQTASGVTAARCNWRGQLYFRELAPAGVSAALRDVIMVPWNGDAATIVIDRVDGAVHPLQLRFRSLANLALAGRSATGTVGNTSLSVHLAYASGGTPTVRALPVAQSCDSMPQGKCDKSRFPGSEWRVDVTGPAARAIHVLNASGTAVTGPRVTEFAGGRVVDTTVGGRAVFVVQRDGDGPLTYRAPRAGDALHVIVDAPRGASGRSDVTATSDGTDCVISVAARAGDGGFDGKPVVARVSAECAVEEDATREAFTPPPAVDPRPGEPGTPGTPTDPNDPNDPDAGGVSGGCGCHAGGGVAGAIGPAMMAMLAFYRRRRRR